MTMEEFVLREYDLSFSQLVGYEGGCGVILVLFMVLPVLRDLPRCLPLNRAPPTSSRNSRPRARPL